MDRVDAQRVLKSNVPQASCLHSGRGYDQYCGPTCRSSGDFDEPGLEDHLGFGNSKARHSLPPQFHGVKEFYSAKCVSIRVDATNEQLWPLPTPEFEYVLYHYRFERFEQNSEKYRLYRGKQQGLKDKENKANPWTDDVEDAFQKGEACHSDGLMVR